MKNTLTLLLPAMLVLSSCSPLHFQIFRTNTSGDTETLTLRSESADVLRSGPVTVRAMPAPARITGKTSAALKPILTATWVDSGLRVQIPAHTTVYVTDVVNALGRFDNNRLFLEHGGRTDSTAFSYPYRRQLRFFRKKRSSPFSFFYRTILYW